MTKALRTVAAALLALSVLGMNGAAADIDDRVTHGYADSNGVKIHYASLGSGPLVVMIHGFPDYWYTWRRQMEGLADKFQVVAIDQRGYNLSDKPAGVENYDVRLLVGDVVAVIKHLGQQKAVVVGHDWGGLVAWQVAINVPEVVDRLIILNLPHPRGLTRELANNPEQQKNSAYARRFQAEGAEKTLTAEGLAELGEGSGGEAEVRRGVQEIRLRRDAQLLQAELPARAVHRRHLAAEEGAGAGADDSRPEGHGAARAGAERQLGLRRARPDADDRADRGTLRPGGRSRLRHEDDARLVTSLRRARQLLVASC